MQVTEGLDKGSAWQLQAATYKVQSTVGPVARHGYDQELVCPRDARCRVELKVDSVHRPCACSRVGWVDDCLLLPGPCASPKT